MALPLGGGANLKFAMSGEICMCSGKEKQLLGFPVKECDLPEIVCLCLLFLLQEHTVIRISTTHTRLIIIIPRGTTIGTKLLVAAPTTKTLKANKHCNRTDASYPSLLLHTLLKRSGNKAANRVLRLLSYLHCQSTLIKQLL